MAKKADEAHKRHLQELAHALKQAKIAGDRADYDLGRWLDRIIEEDAWADPEWPGAPEGGYPNSTGGFNDWCWQILGFRSRKAYYHRNNYVRLARLEAELKDPSSFQRALAIGWTKLDHVLTVAHSLEDLRHWLDRVEKESLTENQLKVEVRLAKGDDPDPSSAQEGANAEAGRNADPATHAGGQMPDGTAYVDDSGVGVLDEQGRQLDAETGEPLVNQHEAPATKVKFPMVFADQDAARMFIRALDLIKRRTGIEGNGECAAMMAASYLATTPHEASHDPESAEAIAVELENILQIIESQWGKKLYTIDRVANMLAAAGVPQERAEALLADPQPEPADIPDPVAMDFPS